MQFLSPITKLNPRNIEDAQWDTLHWKDRPVTLQREYPGDTDM